MLDDVELELEHDAVPDIVERVDREPRPVARGGARRPQVVEHHLEQRIAVDRARRAQRGDDIAERRVRVRIRGERRVAHRGDERGRRIGARQPRAHDDRVDEEPERALGRVARQLAGRREHADRLIGRARRAVERRVQRRVQQHRQRRVRVERHRARAAHERGVEFERETARVPARRARAARARRRQRVRRRAGERLAPEREPRVRRGGRQHRCVRRGLRRVGGRLYRRNRRRLRGRFLRACRRKRRRPRARVPVGSPVRRCARRRRRGFVRAPRDVRRAHRVEPQIDRLPVRHDVMDDERQHVVVRAEPDHARAPERRVGGEIERRERVGVGQRDRGGEPRVVVRDARVGAQVDDRQLDAPRRRDPLPRRAVRPRDDPRAQRRVTNSRMRERIGERIDVERAAQPQRDGNVVRGAVRLRAPQEPQAALRGRQRQHAVGIGRVRCAARALRRVRWRGGGDALRVRRENRRLEQRAHRHVAREPLGDARGHPHRRERMAAQLEEMIGAPDALDAEHLAPDLGERRLELAVGRLVRARDVRGLGQRRAVDLAVRVARQRVEHDDVRGHHVIGQRAAQMRVELGRIRAPRARARVARELDERGEPRVRALAEHDRHRLAHVVVRGELRLDLAQLDAQAAQLHLVIDAADEVEHAVGAAAHEVARAVQPRARRAVRIGHEALGGERRAAQVAACEPDALAAQIQLADHADGQRIQARVQHVRGARADERADRQIRGVRELGGIVARREHPQHRRDHRFGRPIAVDDARVRKRAAHQRERLARRRLAAHRDRAQRRRRAVLERPFGELRRAAGRHVGHRHAFARGERAGARGRPQRVGRHRDGRARHVLREPAFVRAVEIDRLEQHEHVALGRAVARGDRLAMARERAVIDDDALRLAGRARRVDHVRGLMRRHGGQRDAVDLRVGDRVVDKPRARRARERQRVDAAALGDHVRDPRVLQHLREALARVARIERHERAARLERGDQPDEQIDRARQRDAHAHLRAHARRDEALREPRRARVDLAARERALDVGDAARVGAAARVLRNPVMDRDERLAAGLAGAFAGHRRAGGLAGDAGAGARRRRAPGEVVRLPVPRGELAALRFGQPLQIADRRAGRVERVREQLDVARGEALDRVGVEQIGRIDEARVEPAVVALVEAEREIEFRIRHARGQLGRAHLGERRQHAPRAVGGHHLKKRMVARAARDAERVDHLIERHVLVRLRVDQAALRRVDERVERERRGRARRERQRIDEKADQPDGLAALAIRRRHADPDPGLAARAREQRRERGEQHGERRRPARLRQRTHAPREFGGYVERMARAARAALRGPRRGARQQQRVTARVERRAPVRELALALARVEPAALPERVVRVLHRQRRERHRVARRVRPVERRQLREHHVGRPAVRHDVVRRQHEPVRGRIEPDQVRAHERAVREIERLGLVALGDGGRALLARPGARVREIGEAPRAAHRRVHRLQHAGRALGERRAQRLVARDQRVARQPQRVRVEPAVEAQPLGDVVRGRFAEQARVQPEARLRE
ncbi:putative l-ornithine 5-monooxygenase [Burkholderia pseudomallei]|nr:putative l-ornithine 5-monooxygenase [Burkholderia pseudomallei]